MLYARPPRVLSCAIWSTSRSNSTSVRIEISVPPFKVTQGHRNWHLSVPTYDFLLVVGVHSNYMGLSYRLRRFPSKTANFSYPRVFNAPTKRVPLRILQGQWGSKTRILDGIKSMRICACVLTERQTDGRTYRQKRFNNIALCMFYSTRWRAIKTRENASKQTYCHSPVKHIQNIYYSCQQHCQWTV